MRRQIRKYSRDAGAIVGIAVIALAITAYILSNQRLRFPFVEDKPFVLQAEFSTAQAVTPGQGQTIRVSGVRIGDIAKVRLQEGRAIVKMDIDKKYDDLVHTDAKALLRPKTGLKDMFVEISPGTDGAPVAKENWTMPVANTLPDVNPDEIYSALDGDSRDYLRLLVQGLGKGLEGRGSDLREVFRRFEPTHRDLARVNGMVAKRHRNLSRLIHNLNQLNGELASKGDDLAQLVDSSATVFRAFASEDQNVSATLREFPSALKQTTQTLGKVETFANVLGQTSQTLRPAVRKIDPANKAIIPLAKEATPIIRTKIRPFVRDARPFVRSLRPAAKDLAAATPLLTRSFTVLNHLFNLLGYNEGGPEPATKAGRDEGYLFWLAWLNHNGAALFSTQDANGPFRPVAINAGCGGLNSFSQSDPALAMVLAPVLMDPAVCGTVLGGTQKR
jgi:phospholipid/cholesterol/gamma-HCH transport system substrate-binding protein